MLRAQWMPYRLNFRFEARTSRSVMTWKDTYIIKVWSDDDPERSGYGECALFRGLSAEDGPDFEAELARQCVAPEQPYANSSIAFGFETALRDLRNGACRRPFPSEWSEGVGGIPTNGLIWMGDKPLMIDRIRRKLDDGFRCIKLKIGGIDLDDELYLLRMIRREFRPDELELRLDANGAFTPENALERLKRLSDFTIHSLEQPIKADQRDAMAAICEQSPIPIALDEELIGMHPGREYKWRFLAAIRPAYIILKPSLCGGFAEADEWVDTARELGIGWWATSALESNIGLNAIAQWVSRYRPTMPQGLGTGLLYDNNFLSPIELRGTELIYHPSKPWHLPPMS